LWQITSARKWTSRRGSSRDRRRVATVARELSRSKVFRRGTKGHPTNGTKSSTPRGTRTSSVLSTHSSSATRISSAPSNIKLATRHHVRECPTMPQSRVAPQATTPMHAITVERLINILTSAQRSRTSRPCRTSRAIRGPTLDLYSPARWIMCHLNQLRRRLRLWWVRLASTPSPLSYFSIPVSRILSYHKLLLECIAYPYVPWNISC
jgi:hypothetical protein